MRDRRRHYRRAAHRAAREPETRLRITVVEAGRSIFRPERTAAPIIDAPSSTASTRGTTTTSMISRPKAYLDDDGGGRAGDALGRRVQTVSEEDLRLKSLYGLARRWANRLARDREVLRSRPRSTERRRRSESVSEDRRSGPYRQPAMPLSYNLQVLKKWPSKGAYFSPLPIRAMSRAVRRARRCGLYDTCGDVCRPARGIHPTMPIAAESPRNQVTLHDRMLVRNSSSRKAATPSPRRTASTRIARTRSGIPCAGFCAGLGAVLDPHLLLLSANIAFPKRHRESPRGGRPLHGGHKFISAQATIDDETFHGKHDAQLDFARVFRCAPTRVRRHDTRVWESSAGKEPRLQFGRGGSVAWRRVLDEWRSRLHEGSSVRLRSITSASVADSR